MVSDIICMLVIFKVLCLWMDLLLSSQLKHFLSMCSWLPHGHTKVQKVKKELSVSAFNSSAPQLTWPISVNRTTMPRIAQAQIPEFISFPQASHSVQQVLWLSLQSKCWIRRLLQLSPAVASVQASSLWPGLLQELLTRFPDATVPRAAYQV